MRTFAPTRRTILATAAVGSLAASCVVGETAGPADSDERLASPPDDIYPTEISVYPGPSHSGYDDLDIYYPKDAAGAPFPMVTLSCGKDCSQPMVAWLASKISSYGYVVGLFQPNDNSSKTDNASWTAGQLATVETLRQENARSASPAFGIVDVNMIICSGYSMGGGGALIAADILRANDEPVVAVMSLAGAWPYLAGFPGAPPYDLSTLDVPTLSIAGRQDYNVGSDHLYAVHRLLSSTDKLFVNLADVNHYDWIDYYRSSNYRNRMATYVLSFLDVYVRGNRIGTGMRNIAGDYYELHRKHGWFQTGTWRNGTAPVPAYDHVTSM